MILQTRDGYLWLGTEEGLVRFDGVRLTVYSSRTVAAFRQNTVSALAESPDGDLWIGTPTGLIRRHGDVFTSFGTRDGLPDEAINVLKTAPDGAIWIGTQNGGLARLFAGRFSTAATRAGGLPDDRVAALEVEADGSLWIGTPKGLARLQNQRLTSYAGKGVAVDVSALRRSKDGALWIASSAGLLRFAGDRVVETWTAREGLPEGQVNTVFEDRDGSVWIGTAGGIGRMRGGRIERYTAADGLSANVVLAFHEDREGSLWAGTDGGGLVRFRAAPVRTYSRRDGMTSDFVRPILEAADGTMWAGTRGGGVNLIRNGRGAGAIGTNEGLPHASVCALARSADGSMWVGTLEGGIARVSRGKAQALPAAEDHPTAAVRVLFEDGRGALWIGTEGQGLFRFDHGAFQRISSAQGPLAQDVHALREGPDGTLWVGSRAGLSRVQGQKLESLPAGPAASSPSVLALLVDPDGTVWMGTRGEGLLRLRKGRVSAVTARNGLFDDVVFSLLDDQRGNLWMSCNRGIFRVSRAELDDFFAGKRPLVKSISYGEADGMQSAECNGSYQPSAWRSADGGLWFPTIRGVAVVHPSAIRVNSEIPPVILQSLVVDRRELPLASPITIPPGSRSLEIHFTAPSFLTPEKMDFKYQLQGFDDDWVDAGDRRAASYTNLAPGDYLFRVIAANADGVWNRTGASVAMTIQPTFTQSRTFLAGAVLVFAGAAFAIYRLRLRALRLRARELERSITEAKSNIRTLRGLFPICSACKKIRDDGGYWKQIESYVRDHSEAEFSHSICPECMERLYPDLKEPGMAQSRPEPGPS